MDSEMIWTRHIVAPMSDGVQRCMICGDVIEDYRGVMKATITPEGKSSVSMEANKGESKLELLKRAKKLVMFNQSKGNWLVEVKIRIEEED